MKWALVDRLRYSGAARRGGRDVHEPLDATCGAVSSDHAAESLAYLHAREIFERRFQRRQPAVVRAIELWFEHGFDVAAASASSVLTRSRFEAALLLFAKVFRDACPSSDS